ncbi:DivIVA domain-containing protein [Spiroplasma endosymbiont of Nephrotoma flavescens]|uniref:DivIVA domain-containing protein n=1 Tax=Spiroplasma endosymbiont of Nephrotoma flavescens TaxID=3066302 RepID=UPI00313C91C4
MKNDNSFKLAKEDILEKKFQINFKGYDAQEVDRFLDIVQKDYDAFNKIMETHIDEISRLKEKLKEIIEEHEKLKSNYEIVMQQRDKLEEKGLRNVDIINRLSKLESKVNK